MRQLPFPKSYPNTEELRFLELLLSDEESFPSRFQEWKQDVVLADIDYATLRLLPLLYRRLKKNFDPRDEAMAKIRGVYKLAWVKNHRLLSVIEQAVPIFERHGIPVLLLKGVPLLMNIYRDAGARFLGDADLLIPPGHSKQALRIMADAGWKGQDSGFPRSEKFSEESLERIIRAAEFTNEQGIMLDVHWRVFHFAGDTRSLFGFEGLRSRATTVGINGHPYQALSPEDMLLHVILHGSVANIHRPFRWVVDAAAIINSSDINWDSLLAEIERGECSVEMNVAFSFLLQHHFVHVPDSFIRALAAIPMSPSAIKTYYERANTPFTYAGLGALPHLWRTYWKHESRGVFPLSLYHFGDYLSDAWGFSRKRELIPFVLSKLRSRIGYLKKKTLHV